MKYTYFQLALILLFSLNSFAQSDTSQFQLYFSWGYNRETYSNSDIHFYSKKENYDFTFHNVMAHDKPDFHAIIKHPLQVSIPQYNYRIGFMKNNKGLEINFDHTKYVVSDFQTVYVSGHIYGVAQDKDTLLNPDYFHYEHTDGGNFLMINYLYSIPVYFKSKYHFILFLKPGIGIVIPRSDVTLFSHRENQPFHVAGEIAGLEGSIRYMFVKKFYAEFSYKISYANFHNVLLPGDGIAKQRFLTKEQILTFGYVFNKKNK